MTSTLYTVGYQGRHPADLADLLPPGTLVLDIRLSPGSRDPRWSRARLEQALPALGLGYHHEPRLGNLDYRTRDRIRIADPRAAAPIARLITEGRDVALLCVCPGTVGCHRAVVRDLIAARSEPVIVDLPPPSRRRKT
jgi:uncharacterized protein (DUF488 family)